MKIIHIAGARPNFMKLAPILRALEPYSDVQNILLHTGQHYDTNMSDVFFDDLKLPKPDINLGVGSGSHAVQTAQIMQGFEQMALAEKPDLVLVVGDVNSTLACSLVAAKLHIPIAHVEAGLRSFDREMPEEINRLVTDVLSDMLFTPSRYADENLRQQGIPEEKIYFVGNVMVDSLLGALQIARERRAWERWSLSPGEYAVLTLHRASNVDDLPALHNLISTVADGSRRLPVVFPVHPRTLQRMQDPKLSKLIAANPGIILCEPLGYLDFLCLLASAKAVLTDSGGIQAETTILGVPCLTLRWNTEWLETIQQGSNHLVGTDKTETLKVLDEILAREKRPPRYPEGWDGHAGSRIAMHIRRRFGLE
jgi:UDP-N-acetylglucosamine 2-epimerase (non-hydrolysing)